jgi:hypothetical protein
MFEIIMPIIVVIILCSVTPRSCDKVGTDILKNVHHSKIKKGTDDLDQIWSSFDGNPFNIDEYDSAKAALEDCPHQATSASANSPTC